MKVLDWTLLVTTVTALAYSWYWYRELRKWARQCKGARIAIAYKRKAALQAPLLEWLLWCNQLDEDKDSNGRVVFQRQGVSVAIIKRPPEQGPIKRYRINRQRKQAQQRGGPVQVREGKWSSRDETPREAVQ